jgi:hypothetical protein
MSRKTWKWFFPKYAATSRLSATTLFQRLAEQQESFYITINPK